MRDLEVLKACYAVVEKMDFLIEELQSTKMKETIMWIIILFFLCGVKNLKESIAFGRQQI